VGGLYGFWQQGDAISRGVALLLLAMSVGAWVVILWKVWLLRRVRRDIARAVPAFWAAPDVDTAATRLRLLDREAVLAPLLTAALAAPSAGTLEGAGHRESQLTRRLRDALQATVRPLQFGQVMLASIGATAPFIGLFGTVWGIYHALVGLSGATQVVLDKVAGPVGEALIMTAAGLFVAIPAVLAYNAFTRGNRLTLARLDGFAHDLHAYLTTGLRGRPGDKLVDLAAARSAKSA